ncbi:MAG TPA: hypothetical protein VNS10_11255 [Gemmatimonadaceae bacterium]|nr:hypothetical protein [Gemmatimonadaceae bacterium]
MPDPGTVIGLDITDAGRVALGGAMGPEIDQVEGKLIAKDTTGYLVGVTSLHLLRGGEQVWHGEQVQIKKEYVSSVYQRRFSPSRSAALAAVGIGAVALIATRSIFPSGSINQPMGPDSSGTSIRRRRP